MALGNYFVVFKDGEQEKGIKLDYAFVVSIRSVAYPFFGSITTKVKKKVG